MELGDPFGRATNGVDFRIQTKRVSRMLFLRFLRHVIFNFNS